MLSFIQIHRARFVRVWLTIVMEEICRSAATVIIRSELMARRLQPLDFAILGSNIAFMTINSARLSHLIHIHIGIRA